MKGAQLANGYGLQFQDDRFSISRCEHCGFPTIWHNDLIIFPLNLTAESPSDDLPEEIKKDYEEARLIFNFSPRGSAALLRLSIQKLCIHLGQSGKNISEDIKALVKQGLPPKVQEALDIVRVIGNEAVHPGVMDLNDDRNTASQLFKLVNFITYKMITEPAEIDEIYNQLPQEKLEAIKRRDN
ncbi:MAG: hypothetical protein DCF19_00505 [Pseudanabaena frigida]|uniref:DUF4145 domain-containing protein n=1 Tax=Pseudanabaena frigida TaxID=945775 RepID=A0A2W4WKH4_9CYAN|nr:MAG: hypothetical protein DCF19_00505 [Pseudanabaena frigida]